MKTAFKMLDLDKDGFITKEEFIQVIQKNETIHSDWKYLMLCLNNRRLRPWIRNKLKGFTSDLMSTKMGD